MVKNLRGQADKAILPPPSCTRALAHESPDLSNRPLLALGIVPCLLTRAPAPPGLQVGFGSETATPLAAASLTDPSVTLHGPNSPSSTTLAAAVAPMLSRMSRRPWPPPPMAAVIDSPCNLLHGLVPAPCEPSINLKVSTAAGRTKAPYPTPRPPRSSRRSDAPCPLTHPPLSPVRRVADLRQPRARVAHERVAEHARGRRRPRRHLPAQAARRGGTHARPHIRFVSTTLSSPPPPTTTTTDCRWASAPRRSPPPSPRPR